MRLQQQGNNNPSSNSTNCLKPLSLNDTCYLVSQTDGVKRSERGRKTKTPLDISNHDEIANKPNGNQQAPIRGDIIHGSFNTNPKGVVNSNTKRSMNEASTSPFVHKIRQISQLPVVPKTNEFDDERSPNGLIECPPPYPDMDDFPMVMLTQSSNNNNQTNVHNPGAHLKSSRDPSLLNLNNNQERKNDGGQSSTGHPRRGSHFTTYVHCHPFEQPLNPSILEQ